MGEAAAILGFGILLAIGSGFAALVWAAAIEAWKRNHAN